MKEKLEEITKKSPSSIKGLIAGDALTWGDPEEFFYRIKLNPFDKQPYIFKYQSFRFISEHKENFVKELLKYSNGSPITNHKAIWEAFCNAVNQVEEEVTNFKNGGEDAQEPKIS